MHDAAGGYTVLMTLTSISVDICIDCLLIVANDDDSGIEDAAAHRAAMQKMADGPNAGWDVVIGDGVDEFSRTSCDACGSREEGTRHRAWLVHGA